ncbi:MAG: AI-2E family transporter, partial [Candidatus Sericytochromatia bacterium]|nr:AI-2E family transporter [Candidatus Sericytochromatia bacterium]
VAGVILGLLEVIPYFGAFIGMALVSALALSQSFNMFIIALVLTVIIQQIKDNILLPKWLNESIGIHPLGVFISILIGGRVAGFMGIFLAIPLAGLVQALIRVIFSYDSDIAKDIDNKEFMEIESNTIIELK